MRRFSKCRKPLAVVLSGGLAFKFVGCTARDFQQQFANGLTTALTGLFTISARTFANAIFDIDD
ncbi:MAG: hypothetical protein ACYTHJ_04460 [Planctomycetota bacterium]|jgi:hypothetical protein